MATINDKLRSLKRIKKLTYQQLADRSGIPYETISGYLRRGQTPNAYNLIKLANALDITLDVFMDCVENPVEITK